MKVEMLGLAAALTLAACAQSPSAIAPAPMGNAFAATTCDSARAMAANERAVLASLSSAQKGAVVGDAIGVFLIGVPVSSLTGNDREGDIASSKGKLQALEARLASC